MTALENVPSSTFEAMVLAFTGKPISKHIDLVNSPYVALFPEFRDSLLTFDQCTALNAFLYELAALSQIPPPPDPLSMIQGQDAHP